MIDGREMKLEELNYHIEGLEQGERLIVHRLPEDTYHAAPGIGSSLLREARKSMAHYKVRRDENMASSKALDIGSAVHCLTLEPQTFEERFAVQPPEIKRKQGAKWEAFQKANAGKTVVTETEMESIDAMADSLLNQAGKFLTGGYSEVSYWLKDASGLLLKARADYVIGDACIDLKTRRPGSPFDFTRTIKYDYDLQDALYRRVTGLADMIFIGVIKEKPYPVLMRLQGAEVRARAEKKMGELFEQIQMAEELNDYPAYPVELIETELTERERAAMGA